MSKETKKQKLARFKAEGLTPLEAEIRFAEEAQAEAKKRLADLKKQAEIEREEARSEFINERLIPTLLGDRETLRSMLELGGIVGEFEHHFGSVFAQPEVSSEAQETETDGGYHEYETGSFGS